jgi:V/A-type H+-transporting ATPase subunit C
VSGFDYGNARVRAMKSRLLGRQALENLIDIGSVAGLLAALADSPYRQAVQNALVRWSGIDCLSQALYDDLVGTIGKTRRFFSGSSAVTAAMVLRQFDVHNMKTILRGLMHNVPANEVLASCYPIGDLRQSDLEELVHAPDARAAIDLLATWRIPLAQPLIERRATHPHAELFELELAIEHWYWEQAMATGKALFEMAMLQVDASNVLTALRLVGVMQLESTLQTRLGEPDPERLFVGPGRIPIKQLIDATQRESIRGAAEVLGNTPYASILKDALDEYIISHRLSDFERAFTVERLRLARRLILRDPLGPGVFVGYVQLKTNEIANLRAIGQGFVLQQSPQRIKQELITVM